MCPVRTKSAKVSKTLLPHHSAPRLGSVCPHSGFGPWAAVMGHPWPRTANLASCQVTHAPKPAFGQRGLTGRLRSRSKADQQHSGLPAGLSVEEQKPNQNLKRAQSKCGSGLAREGGLTADRDVGFDRVHIRYLGNGHLGFRPDGGSLLKKSAKVSKTLLPHHSAPRLGSGVPVIRQ